MRSSSKVFLPHLFVAIVQGVGCQIQETSYFALNGPGFQTGWVVCCARVPRPCSGLLSRQGAGDSAQPLELSKLECVDTGPKDPDLTSGVACRGCGIKSEGPTLVSMWATSMSVKGVIPVLGQRGPQPALHSGSSSWLVNLSAHPIGMGWCPWP